jgi:succinyl-CoA synthetase beta subunit
MIDATHAGRILAGWRGAPALDREAVIGAITALGALAANAAGVIDAIDINPLVVREPGQGVVALDGLVVLAANS